MRLVRLVLITCTLASTVVFAGVVFGNATGRFRLAPVLSGSMSPSIPTGSLVFAEPVPTSDVSVGDVILFNAPTDGNPLTMHRIYEEQEAEGKGKVYITKGDANDAPDAWRIRLRGATAWRVVHHVPKAGTILGWLTGVNIRMIVLVGGVLVFLMAALSVVWGKGPISWKAHDPHGVIRRRQRKKTTRRALAITTVGTATVGALALAGLAGAQFTATPTPPVPNVASGSLAAPSPLTCQWASATTLDLAWANNTPGFTTGYKVLRSNTSGSGYVTINSPTPDTQVTYTDPSPGPPTLRYYVVQAARSTWTSADSNEMASNACVRSINNFAGHNGQGFSGDGGPATAASLSNPQSAAFGPAGNLWIADTGNHRIRSVDATTGIITTVVGGGGNSSCSYTGSPTGVSLSSPDGITVATNGDLYIADSGNHCVRKVSGGTISTVAGTGGGGVADSTCQYSGDPLNLNIRNPQGVNIDDTGTLYIADTNRNCVRKLVSGVISGVAGGGGNSACSYSGSAFSVSLGRPDSVKSDGAGNVYIADRNNNCIRKVSGGNVSSVAGGGANTACTYSGAASGVKLTSPRGLGIDNSGRVILVDSGSNNCVRLVDGGNISQVAGTGGGGQVGDGGPAVGARIGTPTGIAMRPDGSIFITNNGGDSVRWIVGPW